MNLHPPRLSFYYVFFFPFVKFSPFTKEVVKLYQNFGTLPSRCVCAR